MGFSLVSSREETLSLGISMGKEAKPGQIFCLYGNLGAGKTTFIKGLVNGALDLPFESVTSPTFGYFHIYKNPKRSLEFYHFDLYRLKGVNDFERLGFEEYLYSDSIVAIEWSERIDSLIPQNKKFTIKLDHLENRRRIQWQAT